MTWRATLAGFALGVASTAATLVAIDAWGGSRTQASQNLGRDGFGEALDAILDRYVEPVDSTALLSRGLKQIVASLDPHSHYLTASERKAMKSRARGGTSGLAVVLRSDDASGDRWLEIVGVAPGSAAADAGLHPGDRITQIGDAQVSAMLSQVEADTALVGSVGDTIALAVVARRGAGTKSIALKLRKASASALVEGRLVAIDGGKAAVLQIHAFGTDTGLLAKRQLDKLRQRAGAKGLSAIVIDLRGNPGGEVDQALVVADLFVESGTLTRTRGRGGRILREEKAHAAGTDGSTPIAIVQDRHTASAAELLAAALRDNGRGSIVGEVSFGKGTVQEVHGMPDGSVLTLTIARYFSPKDEVIDGVGVQPDTLVTWRGKSEDDVIDAALGALGLAR